MRTHHEHYRPGTFNEEYGGGRASMGSAIHAFERQSAEQLDEGRPNKRRWPWYVWLLLFAGFLLAVFDAHADEAAPADSHQVARRPGLLLHGWRKPDFDDARAAFRRAWLRN